MAISTGAVNAAMARATTRIAQRLAQADAEALIRHHGAEDLHSSPARARREGQIGCGLMRLTLATDQPRRYRNGAHGKVNGP